jgi:hypothetical protein
MHGGLQQPAVHSVSVPLHDQLRLPFLPYPLVPTQQEDAQPKPHHFHQPSFIQASPMNLHPPPPPQQQQQQQLQEQPPPLPEKLQERRRQIFGPPIACFAAVELPRIVLPLQTSRAMKPTVAAADFNVASPCAPGRASMSSTPPCLAAVAGGSDIHDASCSRALVFDMSAVVVGEMVGRGAFGEVYKAMHKSMQVAVKQIMTNHVPAHMMQDIQSEFQKEVEVMQKLNHPNIVAYIGSSVLGSGVAGLVPLLLLACGFVNAISCPIY